MRNTAAAPAPSPAPGLARAPVPAPALALAPAPAPAKTKGNLKSKSKGKAAASTQTTASGAPDPNCVAEAAIQPPTIAAPASAPVPHLQIRLSRMPIRTPSQALFKSSSENCKNYKASRRIQGSSLSMQLAPDDSIPRPPGERGKNGWNMQTMLRPEHDGDAYNALLATTRNAIKFDEQDIGRLYMCYGQMKHAHSYLKQFKNDWARQELALSALQNRCKIENAIIKGLMVAKKPNGPTS
ncbi:hypothetical protein M407DRAFT_33304 [Tulasnella calospora MUT 4182]|uniref:Uncharacterized protein n=1 Tax=Tulasnella calospora MUT 4182 TaxID=1051891 RepID=A0A0C3L676_9AGAM|nr:hypothetical protein M407DRAFT_33304 [Tulasnella calospora MUT 4182]